MVTFVLNYCFPPQTSRDENYLLLMIQKSYVMIPIIMQHCYITQVHQAGPQQKKTKINDRSINSKIPFLKNVVLALEFAELHERINMSKSKESYGNIACLCFLHVNRAHPNVHIFCADSSALAFLRQPFLFYFYLLLLLMMVSVKMAIFFFIIKNIYHFHQ